MLKPIFLPLVVASLFFTGCGRRDIPSPVKDALENADQYELLSLDPNRDLAASANDFYGHRVLGRVVIKDLATRKRLNDALLAGVRPVDGKRLACFNPRHGIGLIRGGKHVDLLICFECEQVDVIDDSNGKHNFLITSAPSATFDAVLKEKGIARAAN
ncbi:MAG TPA: hypothetical protein VFE47_11220 [Tepidisphaeraceae bacterium]|jgi:hypothetical protein|nr:hypothetical protein [Tepidisphaeraceae bacterium]